MRRDKRLKIWGWGAAIIGVTLLMAWLRREQKSETIVPNFATPVAQQSPEPPKAPPLSLVPTRFRHDADFWPQQPHSVELRYRTLMPDIVGHDDGQSHVWVAQFGGPLDAKGLERLRAKGIAVLCPTVANAFHVRATRRALLLATESFVPKLLGWATLLPEDKVLPGLHEHEKAFAEKTDRRRDPATELRLELYPDADAERVSAAVANSGGAVRASGRDWIEVQGPAWREFVAALASLDDVYALDIARPRLKSFDVASANASNITICQNVPLNLDGTGIKVLVRDQGALFAHPDFGSRVTPGPDVVGQPAVLHSTHVAGIIGATGLADPSKMAKGMAPNCGLVVYDLNGDEAAEPLDALHTFGALLSNHSYGFETGWDSGMFTDNQSSFGTYSSFSRNWDSIVRSENLIMVKAAGNFRNESGPGHPPNGMIAPDFDFYTTVDASSTSKNVIVVGAAAMGIQAGVPTSSTAVLSFSSSGPCTDGRLKPELIADGDQIVSCNTSATAGNQYTTLSGTSMASAVVTGAAALFLQHYQQRTGSINCPPHYLRAVLAQTATDMGRPGPDFLHGFGMLDLQAAINLFDLDNNTNTRVVNSAITATVPERFFRLNSDGVTPIKVTLCWTDEFGDVLAKNAIIDDLDLRLVRVSDQAVFFPYILSSTRPDLPATTGVNSVDTIEQVQLAALAAGSYLIAVRAPSLASNTNFALASSHVLTEDAAPVAKIKASSTSGPAPLSVTFDGTGSTDADGSVAQFFWNFGDGATATGSIVAHVFQTGSFTVTLQVLDDQGASATTTVLIGVNNMPPVASVSISPSSGLPPFTAVFSSAGSVDPDGTIVNYTWTFGDGTTGFGPQVTHTFNAPGLYFISLLVTDDGGATTRTSSTLLAGKTLTASSSRFSLNFAKLGADSFSLTSKNVTVDPNLNPTGLGGSVRIGQAQYSFKFDSKGRFKAPPLSGTLNAKRSQFTVTIRNTNLGGALTGTNATNRTAKAELVRIPFALYFDTGDVFGSTGFPYRYTSTQGKRGAGSLLKQ